MDEEEEKKDVAWILYSLLSELTYLLTCVRRSLVSGTQNEIVVS